MTVTLSPEIERLLNELVKAGRFTTPQAALEAGVARLALDPDPDVLDAEDVADIQRSLEQMKRGEVVDGDELHTRLRARYLGK